MKTLPHQCEFCETIGLDVELYPFRSVLTYMCRTCAKEQYDKFTGHGVAFDQQPQPWKAPQLCALCEEPLARHSPVVNYCRSNNGVHLYSYNRFTPKPLPQPQARIQRPPRDPGARLKANGTYNLTVEGMYNFIYSEMERALTKEITRALRIRGLQNDSLPHDICGPGQPCEVWPDCLCGGHPKDTRPSRPISEQVAEAKKTSTLKTSQYGGPSFAHLSNEEFVKYCRELPVSTDDLSDCIILQLCDRLTTPLGSNRKQPKNPFPTEYE